MIKKLSGIFIFFAVSLTLQSQIQGRVTDIRSSALISCHISVFPDSLNFLTDNNGDFKVEGLSHGLKTIEISYLGYYGKTIQINYDGGPINIGEIILLENQVILEQITIFDDHAKQEQTLSHLHFDEIYFQNNLQGSFAATMEKVPGLSAINVGVGIAKPVIRGLSGNRITVNHFGIKQESQQWGMDHGLELDVFDVERIEIVKGPATIQYGSDAIGGVINIQSGIIVPENTFRSSVVGVYKSNNQHIGGSYGFSLHKNKFFISSRYTIQDYADFRVPAQQFEYNGFVLPITNNTLKNTAGREENKTISIGLIQKNAVSRLTFNHFSLESGLFAGAVGIPRSYTLTDDGNSRNIDNPSQAVDHYRFTLNQSFIFGSDHLLINAGYQFNRRREFTFAEFHNIPRSMADINDNLGIALDLATLSANINYEKKKSFGKIVVGGDFQKQNNSRGGFEFLLPDFEVIRSGLFGIIEYNKSKNTTIIAGWRFDMAKNSSEADKQFIWDANERVIDSLVVPLTDRLFYNWSASIGLNRSIASHSILRLNFSKSFRVPYPSETVSNGIHHGTFRHEVGDPNLKSENGYQFDIGFESDIKRWSLSLSAYFNYFHNYIYLGPVFPAQFSPLPESGQIFRYQQDNAIHTGFEIQWTYNLTPHSNISGGIDFVQTYNTRTGLSLPFTPQPAVKTEIKQSLGKNSFVKKSALVFEHHHYLSAQGTTRRDRTEKPTPATSLFHLGINGEVLIGATLLRINMRCQNIFNTAFLNHLSRYRWINIPEQGRNFIISVSIPVNSRI